MGFTSSEQDYITLSLRISNSFSLLGSIFLVIAYLFYKSLRSFAFKLVLYMSLADIIRSVGFILSMDPESSCITQSLLTSYGSLSGLFWTSIIAFSLYCVVILEVEHIQQYEKSMVVIGYLAPLVIILLPFTTNSY